MRIGTTVLLLWGLRTWDLYTRGHVRVPVLQDLVYITWEGDIWIKSCDAVEQ